MFKVNDYLTLGCPPGRKVTPPPKFLQKNIPESIMSPGISEAKLIFLLFLCTDAAFHASVDSAYVGSNL